MVNSGQQIIKLIEDNKAAFEKLGAKRIGLFGSFIRGEQTDKSDIDLLVDFLPEQKSFRNLMGTADLAENLMGRRVEIVTPGSVSPYLAPFIDKEIKYVKVT